jgi:hypothetical protein
LFRNKKFSSRAHSAYDHIYEYRWSQHWTAIGSSLHLPEELSTAGNGGYALIAHKTAPLAYNLRIWGIVWSLGLSGCPCLTAHRNQGPVGQTGKGEGEKNKGEGKLWP